MTNGGITKKINQLIDFVNDHQKEHENTFTQKHYNDEVPDRSVECDYGCTCGNKQKPTCTCSCHDKSVGKSSHLAEKKYIDFIMTLYNEDNCEEINKFLTIK